MKKALVILMMVFCFVLDACSQNKALDQNEVLNEKEGFDNYGGYTAIKGTATGRFHLDKINGRHFLITPEGNAFISIGLTHTVALGRQAQSRYNYFEADLSSDWDKASSEIATNFKNWGYNTLGYGSHKSTQKLLPYFAGCHPLEISAWRGKGVKFPDVFSDSWKIKAKKSIENMATQYANTPNLIGIYWTDIPVWDATQAMKTAGKTWVDAIRELPEDAPGKKRYNQFLLKKGTNAPDEDFLVLIAKEVYSHIGPLTRKLFPETLIFGDRYAGWRLPLEIIKEALPYIDAVSVQPYSSKFNENRYDELYKISNKPIIFCDHNMSFNTEEHSKVMWETLPDVASVGKAHQRYLRTAFSKPYMIGYHKCQYIDRFQERNQLLKQGLLQVDGQPYEEWVEWVKKNNWELHHKFMNLNSIKDE